MSDGPSDIAQIDETTGGHGATAVHRPPTREELGRALRAVKRSPEYRRVRCHLRAVCPADAWHDRPSGLLFTVFALARHSEEVVAFAVRLDDATVRRARLVRAGGGTVTGLELRSALPACP